MPPLEFFSPVSNITPFTYRDGETYLQNLRRLRSWIDEVAELSNAQILSVINQFDAGMALALQRLLTAQNAAMNSAASAAAAEALAELMVDVQDEGLTYLLDNGELTDGAIGRVLNKRYGKNLLDYGVSANSALAQDALINTILAANPGETFYVPPGNYRVDDGIISHSKNTLVCHDDARFYAGDELQTLISVDNLGDGYAEDCGIIGGTWDGNLLAHRIMSIKKVIRFTLERATFIDGTNRGLVTETGPGAELLATNLRFYNTGVANVADNIAIEAKMGDSHFSHIIIRDWTVGVRDIAGNRWDRIHPWIGPDNAVTGPQMTSRYPTSVAFDFGGLSDVTDCMADTMRTAFKLSSNGAAYTPPSRFIGCNAIWGAETLPAGFSNQYLGSVIDNTDAVGGIFDRLTVSGMPEPAQPIVFCRDGEMGGVTTAKLTTRNTFSYGFVRDWDTGVVTNSLTNTLSYEHGIQQGDKYFLPTLVGASGAGAHAYYVQDGRMHVDGTIATYHIRLALLSDATAGFSGTLTIGNIPEPSGDINPGLIGMGTVALCKNFKATGAVMFGGETPRNIHLTLDGAEMDIAFNALRNVDMDIMLTLTVPFA